MYIAMTERLTVIVVTVLLYQLQQAQQLMPGLQVVL
jgi:hypothetical protein